MLLSKLLLYWQTEVLQHWEAELQIAFVPRHELAQVPLLQYPLQQFEAAEQLDPSAPQVEPPQVPLLQEPLQHCDADEQPVPSA